MFLIAWRWIPENFLENKMEMKVDRLRLLEIKILHFKLSLTKSERLVF